MPLNSMLLDKYLHDRKRLKCKYKYINFCCEKVGDIVVTFRNYVIAELNRMLSLDTGDSRLLIVQHISFLTLCRLIKKSASTFFIIKVEICIIIKLFLSRSPPLMEEGQEQESFEQVRDDEDCIVEDCRMLS
jgi:hypothetical protein